MLGRIWVERTAKAGRILHLITNFPVAPVSILHSHDKLSFRREADTSARLPSDRGSKAQHSLEAFCHVKVMVWELLTCTKFYGENANTATVMDALTGVTQLATEQALTLQAWQGLGKKTYRDSVIAMLDRDPSKRPPVSQLVRNWTTVFKQATVTPSTDE
jgi:hypothetical protein